MASDDRELPEEQVESQPQDSQETDIGEIFAAWQFPEREVHDRGKSWYVLTGAVLILVMLYAYLDSNPLLAVIMLLGLTAFIISEIRNVEIHQIIIAEDGVIIGPSFFQYEDLRSFYVVYQPPQVKMLYIEPRAFWRAKIGIPLEDQDPVAIREILLEFIPEDLEREDEPMSDFLGRILKF